MIEQQNFNDLILLLEEKDGSIDGSYRIGKNQFEMVGRVYNVKFRTTVRLSRMWPVPATFGV